MQLDAPLHQRHAHDSRAAARIKDHCAGLDRRNPLDDGVTAGKVDRIAQPLRIVGRGDGIPRLRLAAGWLWFFLYHVHGTSFASIAHIAEIANTQAQDAGKRCNTSDICVAFIWWGTPIYRPRRNGRPSPLRCSLSRNSVRGPHGKLAVPG